MEQITQEEFNSASVKNSKNWNYDKMTEFIASIENKIVKLNKKDDLLKFCLIDGIDKKNLTYKKSVVVENEDGSKTERVIDKKIDFRKPIFNILVTDFGYEHNSQKLTNAVRNTSENVLVSFKNQNKK